MWCSWTMQAYFRAMWIVIMILTKKIASLQAVQLTWSHTVETVVIIWHSYCSKFCNLLNMSAVSCHVISLVSELSVVMMVDGCFRCDMGKIFCHDEICLLYIPWVVLWSLSQVVNSASGVMAWFPISWYCRPTFILIW